MFVIGSFRDWDPNRAIQMRQIDGLTWESNAVVIQPGTIRYKYLIRDAMGREIRRDGGLFDFESYDS